MEDKKEKQTNGSNGEGCAIGLLIIFLIIFIPTVIGFITNSVETSSKAKHETKLIEEGKVESAEIVINEIVEKIKGKESRNLNSYLADDFSYYDKDNYEHKYIYSFYDDLQILSTNYEIERRGDTSKNDIVTYRIYWNVVEENKSNGIDKTSQYYCLQKITIMLKRVVKENEITYEIEKIILTDN